MGSKTFHRHRPSVILFISKAQESRGPWDGIWSGGESEGGLQRLEERKGRGTQQHLKQVQAGSEQACSSELWESTEGALSTGTI